MYWTLPNMSLSQKIIFSVQQYFSTTQDKSEGDSSSIGGAWLGITFPMWAGGGYAKTKLPLLCKHTFSSKSLAFLFRRGTQRMRDRETANVCVRHRELNGIQFGSNEPLVR